MPGIRRLLEGRLGALLFASLKAQEVATTELVLELLDAPFSVHELLLTRKERMASVADVNLQFFPRTPRGKRIPARARYLGREIIGVNAFLHCLKFPQRKDLS